MRGSRLLTLAGCIAVLVSLVVFLWPVASAVAFPTCSFQLTHNVWEDSQPSIGGGQLAWHCWDGNDWEIKLFDLASGTTVQLTSNGFGSQDQWPSVDPLGRYVVYTSYDSHQGLGTSNMAIKLHDRGSGWTRTVGVMDWRWSWGQPETRLPRVSGDSVVWVGYEGEVAHVYLYSISSGVTQDLGPGYTPVLGDSYVTWCSEGSWIGAYRLTDGARSVAGFEGFKALRPLSLSGDTLLFSGAADYTTPRQLALSGLEVGSQFFREITLNGRLHSGALLGGRVAWADDTGLWLDHIESAEPVLLYASSEVGELTLSDQGIAWSTGGASPWEWRVFYHEYVSGTTTCVSEGVSPSQNATPCLSQGTVVWKGNDGTDAEIFMANTSGFPDVPDDHPGAAAISDLSSRSIVNGFDDGFFRPMDPVTRRQFAKMIVLGLDLEVTEGGTPLTFKDVEKPSTSLYPDDYVAVAAANDLIKGYAGGYFKPYADITRAQLLTIVVRAAQRFKPSALLTPPTGWDGVLPAGDPTHGSNIAKAEYNGLLNGITLGSFSVTGKATRGEIAQIIWNLREK